MSDIKKYKNKKGEILYKFQVYLGVDPLTGKKKRTNRQGFKTLREAKISKAQLLAGVEEVKTKKSLTFDEVYQEWWSTYKLGLKSTTIYTKENLYKRDLKVEFGNLKIDKIDKPLIQKYINKIVKKFKGFKLRYTFLKQIFNYALSEGYIDKLPYQGVIISRKVVEDNKSKDYKYWSDKQVMDFLKIVKNNYPTKWHAIFRTLIYTGMRASELLSLHWSDIDFKASTISIKRRAIKLKRKWDIDTLKTKSSERTISIDKETLLILEKWKIEQNFLFKNSDIVFIDTKGDYISTQVLYSKLNKINKKFNLGKYKIHAFRHNHTSMLVRAGVPIEQISQRLGHSSIKTTMDIYSHISKEQKIETIDLLLKYLEK